MASEQVSSVLTLVLTGAVLTYLLRRALTSKAATTIEGILVLTYPTPLRVAGTAASAGLAVLGASIPAWAGTDTSSGADAAIAWSAAFFVGGLGAYGMLEFPIVRIEVREHGILGRSPWRRKRFIAWGSIASVQFSPSAQWFIVRATDGQAIRAHLYLSGVRQLYDALKKHVSADAWKDVYRPFEGPW